VILDDAGRRRLTRAGLVFNAPLGEPRAGRLVELLTAASPRTVADLGCGTGELLLRLCEATGARGIGIDLDAEALAEAREAAEARGLGGRVSFEEGDLTAWEGTADVVVSVGASHAWGGTSQALEGLRARVANGGRVLLGDGIWMREPRPDAMLMFGELPDLAGLCSRAADPFRIVHHAVSTLDEWDDFESRWREGLELADDEAVRAFADERRRQYLEGYRDVLGFAWLVLAPS
jgi:cyclopropane fatty-acyl-phospholipid synthase-like methyltransferase